MTEKEFELFSKALLILWEGTCEANGVTATGSRVVRTDIPTPPASGGETVT